MTSDKPVPWVQHRRLPPLDPEALRRSTEGVRQRRIEREAADRLDRAAVALAEANETVEAASLVRPRWSGAEKYPSTLLTPDPTGVY